MKLITTTYNKPIFTCPQTSYLNDASDSTSSTTDDWMQNVSELQSHLMTKNELLKQEIKALTSQQKDKLRFDKAVAVVERSNAHVNSIKFTTHNIETCVMNTGEGVEKLHSNIQTCKRLLDICVNMNKTTSRNVSQIM